MHQPSRRIPEPILMLMINPLDIRKHEFTRAWRGYDRDEVHALLDAIAREFDELTRRNQALNDQLKLAEGEAGRYRQTEKTLQDAAVNLQQTLEEKLRGAEQDVARLIQDARAKVEEELRAGREQTAALRAELQALEDEKSRFYLRFQNLLRGQAEMLESMMDAGARRPDNTREG
jgi:cell division initiation protein